MYLLIQQAPLRWPDPVRHGINVSEEAKDLITKLLMKDRKQRLGRLNDVNDILSHEFFKDIDLKALQEKQVPAEFIPIVDQTGLNNFDSDITNEKPEESMVPPEVVQKILDHDPTFKDFGFSHANSPVP